MTFPSDLLPDTLDEAQRIIEDATGEHSVSSIIFECSALKMIDVHEFNSMRALNLLALVMGAKPYWVGLRPDIIKYLVMADVDIAGIQAFLGLSEALEHLDRLKNLEFR
jgi:hypothetical protein